ncbi:MAG: SDR family oxidoreductase [Candidatus Tectomicrobia bacterium]|nr:SDR family oxidoreductase [Candidatus Tectomicrobia bacterium]
MARRLAGQTIIVTGGGRGFGEQKSKALAREGAHVAVADVAASEAERVAREIAAAGGTAVALATDVTVEAQVEDMVKQTLRRFGRIDVLVNNAGVAGPRGELHTLGTEDWDRVFSVNVRGVFFCSRAVLPHMIGRKSGHIVNVSSTTARTGFTHIRSLPYTVTKWTVEGISWGLSVQMEKYGIRVNALCPGLAVTNFQTGTPAEYFKGQRCWKPDHTAGPLLYILTEMEGTGKSVEAPAWHRERGTLEQFSYIHD